MTTFETHAIRNGKFVGAVVIVIHAFTPDAITLAYSRNFDAPKTRWRAGRFGIDNENYLPLTNDSDDVIAIRTSAKEQSKGREDCESLQHLSILNAKFEARKFHGLDSRRSRSRYASSHAGSPSAGICQRPHLRPLPRSQVIEDMQELAVQLTASTSA